MAGSEGIRRGSRSAFWNAASVSGAGTASTYAETGRKTNMFTLFIDSSGTATFKLQAAHSGNVTSEGILPDDAPSIWHDLWYLGTSGLGNSTQVIIGGTGAFTIASLVPDFEVDWVRLVRTDAGAAVTVTAGFEAWGD